MKLTTPNEFNVYKRNDDLEELLFLIEHRLRTESNDQHEEINIIINDLFEIQNIQDVIIKYKQVGWKDVQYKEITGYKRKYTHFKFIF